MATTIMLKGRTVSSLCMNQLASAETLGTSVTTLCNLCLCTCRLRDWVEAVLWEREGAGAGSEIYRMKGIVHVCGSNRPQIVQAVRELYDITEAFIAHAASETRLVVIGRNLDHSALQATFQRCRSSAL